MCRMMRLGETPAPTGTEWGGAMITWIAVGIVFVIGGYAHYASLDGRVVLILCIVILTLALVADWFVDQPARFDF
jgi:hypothetical protein